MGFDLRLDANWRLLLGIVVLSLAGALVWAWRDGGIVEQREITAPALLPETR